MLAYVDSVTVPLLHVQGLVYWLTFVVIRDHLMYNILLWINRYLQGHIHLTLMRH